MTAIGLKVGTNYDGIFDVFCEKNKIEFADGFSPYWDPKIFDNPSLKMKIYRLHGCLYWFETDSGKNVKIPVRGLDLNKNKYISAEGLTETLIYPTINKDKFSQIYSWLDNRFIESLSNSKLLIVIGYSFRDKDINYKIKEALKSNGLWLLLISPNASSLRDENFHSDNIEEYSRVQTLDLSFQESLLHGRLYQYVDTLIENIVEEEKTLKEQYQSASPKREWDKILIRYSRLGRQKRKDYLKQTLDLMLFNSRPEVESLFLKYIDYKDRIYR